MRIVSALRRSAMAAAAAMAALALAVSPAAADTNATTGTTTWRDWSFSWNALSEEGLMLTNVDYRGKRILARASLPVMRVYYNSSCGPYSDQLAMGYTYGIPWANNNKVAQRSFMKDGREWLEMGIYDQIGSYNLYQAWYISADGIIDAHVYSSGLQCNFDHRHYPYWRMDFDLDGPAGDTIQRLSNGSWVNEPREFDGNGTTTYRVFDQASGISAQVIPGPGDWPLPNRTVVDDVPANDRAVYGRVPANIPSNQYNTIDRMVTTYREGTERPYSTNAPLNGDVAVVYRARMPHPASEGSTLWHSSGPRFVISFPQANRAPVAAANGVPTGGAAPLAVAFTASGSSDPDGDALTYAWNFGDGSTGTGVSPSHTYTTPGTYTATVTVKDPANLSSTATVRVVVNQPAATVQISDDFALNSLNARWTLQDRLGGGTASVTGTGLLRLTVPGGTAHPLWVPNDAVQLVEPTTNSDHPYEAKFTTTPTERFQEQGIITKEADGDWLAFDLWSDGGGRVHAWIGAQVNGAGPTTLASRENLAVTAGAPIWLRVTRTANVWVMSVSSDGVTYTDVSSASHNMVAATVGVFAGNDGTSGAPAFTTYVDYFFDRANPIDPEDGGTGSNRAPVAAAAAAPSSGVAPLAVSFSSAGSSDPDADTLSYRWDFGDGSTSTLQNPTHTYAAAGTYTARLTVTDPSTASASADAAVTVSAGSGGGLTTDFSGATPDPRWTLTDPVGNGSATLNGAGQLQIAVPAGSGHPLWVPNLSAQLTAAAPNIDGTVTVKFDSVPTGQYTEQGLIYREADDDWLAFDLWSENASGFNTWIGAQVNGAGPTTFGQMVHLNQTSGPVWLRVNRTGDRWTMSVSSNGTTFTEVSQFNHTMQVARLGPYAGNDGANPAFTSVVDSLTDSNG